MGVPLAQSPPLFVPKLLFKDRQPTAVNRLDEPIWEQADIQKLLAWCAYADILTQVEEIYHSGRDPLGGGIREQLGRMCHLVAPNRPLMRVLDELRISSTFPSLGRALRGDPATSPGPVTSPGPTGTDYFAHVSILNQLSSMASQLHEDSDKQQNHKYIAHQIALLYQCLNQVRGEARPFKKRIEEKFEEVKSLTENTSAPKLSEAYKQWLRRLTSDIQEMVGAFPPQLSSKLGPIAEVYRASASQLQAH
eukprot:TRINITY_DN17908_c0_g1_i1.p1 TRINITY_DN17908_c0_g1~~TRINITY_DN17908_c0_g1_i1.p1  ORF type:complete len:250 (-),score=45.48 TRINITY_DN17908_c0_g1_i1:308-1057(-)